jgi:nickel transport protein
MKKSKGFLFLVVFILSVYVLFPLMLMPHGMNHKQLKGGLGIEAAYLDGSPMAGCDVEIYSPADKESPFQTGVADKHGRFIFFPNQKGTWKLVVDDGMGHRLETTILVDKELNAEASASGDLQIWQKILMALCLIFGLTGSYYYFLAKKKFKST